METVACFTLFRRNAVWIISNDKYIEIPTIQGVVIIVIRLTAV